MLTTADNLYLCQTNRGTPMGTLLRRYWVPALLAEEVPAPDSPPVRVTLMGERLVAYRDTTGNVGLVDEFCPHRRASLFWGRNEEEGLRCVYHGWKFNAAGDCVDMPSEPPDSNFKSKVRVTAYPTREYGGIIWAYLGPKELNPELPELEWARVPNNFRIVSKTLQESNWVQGLEGGIDSSHVSFLHARLDDIPASTGLANEINSDRSPRFFVKTTDFGILIGARREAGDDSYYWRLTPYSLPFYTMIPGGLDTDRPLSGHAWVPMDDNTCWMYTFTWHPERPISEFPTNTYHPAHSVIKDEYYRANTNPRNNFLIDREMQRTFNFSGIENISTQDRMVQETMDGPIVDRSLEHLGTSDTAIIAMRRRLIQQARELEQGIEPYAASHGDAFRSRSVSVILKRDIGLPFDEAAKELLRARA